MEKTFLLLFPQLTGRNLYSQRRRRGLYGRPVDIF
jgi:hypothetical protein